jgi:prepilin-type N-terminal cleavage/methylation domain-containing protein
MRGERGYTLVELLVVMLILGLVMTPLVASFASAMVQEVDQSRREQAYANARLALQRMRVDIHCATGVAQVEQNAYGGFTLTLAEVSDTSPTGWCPGVIPAGSGSSGVQWCTIPYPGSTTRFVLYRFLGTNPTDCNGGSGSTFQVDYLAAAPGVWPTNSVAVDSTGTGTPTSWVGNLWPTPPACLAGRLPTVAVDLNVAVDPVGHPTEHYELADTIALRNADRCT